MTYPTDAERILATIQYLRATGAAVVHGGELGYVVRDAGLTALQRERLRAAGFVRQPDEEMGEMEWRVRA